MIRLGQKYRQKPKRKRNGKQISKKKINIIKFKKIPVLSNQGSELLVKSTKSVVACAEFEAGLGLRMWEPWASTFCMSLGSLTLYSVSPGGVSLRYCYPSRLWSVTSLSDGEVLWGAFLFLHPSTH